MKKVNMQFTHAFIYSYFNSNISKTREFADLNTEIWKTVFGYVVKE